MFNKKMLGIISAGLIMGCMSVTAMADDDISVSVSVYDYSATENGLAGASANGVILDRYEVKVPAGTLDKDVIVKALQDNNIDFVGADSWGSYYISSINGLAAAANPSATPDYSGWMLEYNGDGFTNWGIGTLGANKDGVLADGDVIEFDYSLYMGADLGTLAQPTLSYAKVGTTEFNFKSNLTGYDDTTYEPVFEYTVNGEKLSGNGTIEDPFVLSATIDKSALESLSLETSASAYFYISPVDELAIDEPINIQVCSRYGKTSHYELTLTAAADDKAEPTGDASVTFMFTVCMLGMAAMLVTRKSKCN